MSPAGRLLDDTDPAAARQTIDGGKKLPKSFYINWLQVITPVFFQRGKTGWKIRAGICGRRRRRSPRPGRDLHSNL
jgi:hypothetical protein